VVQAAEPRHHALDAHAEAGVRHRAVAARVEVPGEGVLRKIVRADAGGNLWRTTGDIADRWEIMSTIGFTQDDLAPFGGPGRWNDPDMLEVGNGKMSAAEYRAHMTLRAVLAAPLIAGHDVGSSSPETIALLTNRDVIAIDREPLGRPGRRVVQRGPFEVWTRPLTGKRVVGRLI